MDYVSLPISASSRINNQLPVLNMSLPLFLERGRARTTACLPSPALLLTSRFNLHLCLAMPIRSARGICFVAWGLPSPSPARLLPATRRETGLDDVYCRSDRGQRWFRSRGASPRAHFSPGISYLARLSYGKEISELFDELVFASIRSIRIWRERERETYSSIPQTYIFVRVFSNLI